MTKTLEFTPGASEIGTDSFARLDDKRVVRHLEINQTNGLGEIKIIYLTAKEANELREWLNKNLDR